MRQIAQKYSKSKADQYTTQSREKVTFNSLKGNRKPDFVTLSDHISFKWNSPLIPGNPHVFAFRHVHSEVVFSMHCWPCSS